MRYKDELDRTTSGFYPTGIEAAPIGGYPVRRQHSGGTKRCTGSEA